MSAFLALILLAAAAWFVSNMAGGPSAGRREPVDSVSEFARAMNALDPNGRPTLSRPPAVRVPQPRR